MLSCLTISYSSLSYLIVSNRMFSYLIVPWHILSYTIVHHLILSYFIISFRILSDPVLSHLIVCQLSYRNSSCLIVSYCILSSVLILFYCILSYFNLDNELLSPGSGWNEFMHNLWDSASVSAMMQYP